MFHTPSLPSSMTPTRSAQSANADNNLPQEFRAADENGASENPTLRNKPTIIGFSSPGPEAWNKARADKGNIKKIRNTATSTACSQCLKSDKGGIPLRKCAKCKAAWYCSVECQRKHWPLHKIICIEVEGAGMGKLILNFSSNPAVFIALQMCVALKMDLINKPTRGPFLVTVHVGIEPDLPQFLQLMRDVDEPLPKEEIQGMFQVNAVRIEDPSIVLTESRMTLWRRVRENVDKAGHHSDPVGFVQFVKGMARDSVSSPLHISSTALKLAKDAEPMLSHSSMTGQITEEPLTADSCIRFINAHIRSDKKNQFMLRKTMSLAELQVIRDLAKGNKTGEANILREKMDADPQYRVLVW